MKSYIILYLSIIVLILNVQSCKNKKSYKDDSSNDLTKLDTQKIINSNHNPLYFIQQDTKIIFRPIEELSNLNFAFNSFVYIIDTISNDTINGLNFYWLKVLGIEQKIPSLYLSKFKFPFVEKGREIKRIDEDGEIRGGNTIEKLYTIDAIGCLFKYCRDTLNWKENSNIIFYSEGDEESLWRQKACRVKNDSLSFYLGVQLFVYVTNLASNKLSLQNNYLYNDEVKIWYTIYYQPNTKDTKVFCRVIEKDGYIQLAVDYDYFYDYDYITKELNSILKNKKYSEDIWKRQISLDEQFENLEKFYK